MSPAVGGPHRGGDLSGIASFTLVTCSKTIFVLGFLDFGLVTIGALFSLPSLFFKAQNEIV